MVDIIEVKKDNIKVYPQTHETAVLLSDVVKTTVSIGYGLNLEFYKRGKVATMSIFGKPTSVIPTGETNLGEKIPDEYLPLFFNIGVATCIEVSTPKWDNHLRLYFNAKGAVYLYCSGNINTNTHVYLSHVYLL